MVARNECSSSNIKATEQFDLASGNSSLWMTNPWELYNFSVDRVEMNDLSNKHPQRVKQMAAAWDKWGEANQVTPLPRDLGVGYLKAD